MASEEFTINKAYAEKYNKWRAKEELQKLKDKYGDVGVDDADDSSSSSESEDEDAEALTAQLDKDWLKTLSALKSKDPKIYNAKTTFYHSEEEDDDDEEEDDDDEDPKPKSKAKTKKQKPVFLKDYERKLITEKDGQVTSESEDEYRDDEPDNKPGYYKEQEEIRESFKKAGFDDSDESSDDGFLTKRKKSKVQQAEEEEDYLNWLKGQKSELSDDKTTGTELEPLKDYWADPSLDAGEKFLRDYILNKGHIDKDADRIPTYNEVVDEEEDFSEEEELLDKQEEFERKYNFRYEEPDPEFIKSYPRTIKDTVRRKDTTRAEKRQQIRERKQMEKDTKKEEIKQLKNLKKKEIQDKIEKLKMITGNPSLAFNDDDLNEDFDPKKHDEMMKKYFDEDYYDEEGVEDTKPEVGFSDEDLETETWDTWTGGTEEDPGEYDGEDEYTEPHVDDEDFNMDADYDPSQAISKKQKKKSKLAKALKKTKPVFDPEEKSFEQYLEEYYELDCEDVIGDMPCRFKYRQVTPNDYGLSTDEILKCKDKELNSWVSLKKMSQYMTTEEEAEDLRVYRNKGKNQRKKLNLLSSLQEEERNQEEKSSKDLSQEKKKKKKQKKKMKKGQNSVSTTSATENVNTVSGKRKADTNEHLPTKKAKLNKSPVKLDEPLLRLTNNSPKKKEKMLKPEKSQTKPAKGPVNDCSGDAKSGKAKMKPGETLSDLDSSKNKKNKNQKASDSPQKSINSAESDVSDSLVCQKVTTDDSKQLATKCQKTKGDSVGPLDRAPTVVPCKSEDTYDSSIADKQKMSKRKRKNLKKKKNKSGGQTDNASEKPAKKQKTKKEKNKLNIKKPKMTDERLLAYGIDPKKYRYMQLKKYAYEES